jgi:aldose 1-epimerase
MIELRTWGELPGGEPVMLATLADGHSLEVRVSSYGASLVSIRVPDRAGLVEDVLLGFDRLIDYLDPALQAGWPYLGSTIGRTANRIAGARFTIDGQKHRLAANEGDNQLHGGPVGFDRVAWRAEILADAPGVRLRHVSPDGDQGFPGRLEVQADFLLGAPGEIIVRYAATTDRPTHVGMALHPYFNLAGRRSRSIAQHRLTVAAGAMLPIDANSIPLPGPPMPVVGTPFDLREGRMIGTLVQADHPQLRMGDGLNHCFLLDPAASPAARLEHSESGRCLELVTTEPGLQIYSANAFDGSLRDGEGRPFVRRQAIALEAQHFPDSPNRPDFPSTLLQPGEPYLSETRLRFTVE